MNHQCDYCHKELKRLMFCNHSHQVMFHKNRVDKSKVDEVKEQIKKVVSKPTEKLIEKVNKSTETVTTEEPLPSLVKKEGYHFVPYMGLYVKDK